MTIGELRLKTGQISKASNNETRVVVEAMFSVLAQLPTEEAFALIADAVRHAKDEDAKAGR